MLRRLPSGLITVLLIAALTGCGDGGSNNGSSNDKSYSPADDPNVNPDWAFEAAPRDRGKVATDETLRLILEGSPNTLNPIFTSSLVDFMVVDALFSDPFTIDKDMTWSLNEDMVESFTHNEEHTEFILKLKPGLKWHDGHPFTAHDIVFSWRAILDPKVPAITFKTGTDEITECVALDDRTVKFVHPEVSATWKWDIGFPIIPKHLFEKHRDDNPDLKTGSYYNDLARNPVGCGPYKIVEWISNEKIVVERWEDYPGDKPYFKRIVFKIIPDPAIALLQFEKGEIDALRQLTAQQFALETQRPSFTKVGYKAWAPQWTYSYIGWNMDGSNPFFTDKRVRHAMTHALNIPLAIEKISYNLPEQCNGIYHPDSPMYNPDIKLLKYDPARAAELLDEAGWRVDEQDGWRYKTLDGKKVKFEFTTLVPQGSKSGQKYLAIFQQNLKKLGVMMDIHILEWSAFLEKVRHHEFQAEMAAWGTGADPDMGRNTWHSKEYEAGRNYGGYANPEVDKLYEQGRRELDPDKRSKIYQQIHKLLYEDQPYTWVYNAPTLSALNRRIRGIQFSPRGIYLFSPSHLAWWTPRKP